MSTTIFCTFEQQDLADLAMGHVRQIRGVKSIHYVIDHAAHQRTRGATNSVSDGMTASWGLFGTNAVSTGDTPSLPASVKITCDDAARRRVVSMLVNMHAYKIVTTP